MTVVVLYHEDGREIEIQPVGDVYDVLFWHGEDYINTLYDITSPELLKWMIYYERRGFIVEEIDIEDN